MAANPNPAERDIEALRDDLALLRADFAKLADTLGGTAVHAGRAARSNAEDAGEAAQLYAREATATAAKQIEEKPFLSVLIAFGVGVLLALIADRRGHR